MRSTLLRWLLVTATACGLATPCGHAQDNAPPDPAGSSIEKLQAKGVEIRRDAAARIRASDRDLQRRALPALIDRLMSEKDGQVRLAVLDALVALGTDAAPAIPALVHTLRTDYGGLGKEELHQDYRSALALAAIGKPAVEGLRGLLGERKENVRAEVIMALGRLGPDAEAAIPDLIPLLGDKSERIRREATLSLGRIGKAAIGPLVDASQGQDALARSMAVEALGHLASPDARVHSVVAACAHGPVPEVQAAALGSLAKFGLPAETLLPILDESLRHKDERVRRAAISLVIERRTLLVRMAPVLKSLLTDPHEDVSWQAAFLLSRIGPDAIAPMLEALRRVGSRIDPIAEAMALIGRPAVAPLTQALKDPEPRVRRGAALALARIRPLAKGVVRDLTAGLDDPDRDAKEDYLAALVLLGPRAGDAVPAVRGLLGDDSAEIRVRAIQILAQAAPRDDQLLGDFLGLLDDADPRVQRRAIETIGSLGPPGRKAMKPIIAKLSSPQPEVRLAAAEWIEGHGLGGIEAIPSLGVLLADPTPKIRMTAARTLGKFGKLAQSEFSRLSPLVADPSVEVREVVTAALGNLELGPEALRPHFSEALRDDKPEVRRAAIRAIQRLGPGGALFVPDLILLATSKEGFKTVERSLRLYERDGPDGRSIPELIKLLDHEQGEVRLLAIKFLGLAGSRASDAIPALDRLREDASLEVRKQAEVACEKIRVDAESGR